MPDSPDENTSFTPAPSGEGASRPASSRAGSSGLGWSPPTIEALQAMLPQYEIVSILGHGGMGAVYRGKQISLDRMVAIKILPPGLEDDDAKFTERFKQEARTMAKMNHPGIVSVYDFGETAEGQFYFVMEYVDGTDVAKMIQASKKLPSEHALAIAAHVCDALAYAHGNGVVHRDIKPANILINQQGQVKVADFGLAKHEDPSQTSGLTKTGMAMGTPDYVAPEALIMGVNVDGRADLYAIGVMLYQMLTGEIPRGLFLMPSVKSNGEIDPRFDKIITRAMQTDREERYQKASEIRADLDVILTAPRVKQDASKAVAAVPQGAVKNVPGQRSAAQKPMPKGPVQPGAKAAAKGNLVAGGSDPGSAAQRAPGGAAKPGSVSRATGEKSKTGIYIGIAATVALLIGLVFMFKPKAPIADEVTSLSSDSASGGQRLVTSSPASAPIKVTETPKPKPIVVPQGGTRIPSSLAGGGGNWVDALAQWWLNNPKGTDMLGKEAGGSRALRAKQGILLGQFRDVAVRATVSGKNVGWNLRLRHQTALAQADGGRATAYRATLDETGSGWIRLDLKGQGTVLKQFALPPGFSLADRHTMEFRAQGNVLTLSVDGLEMARVQDSTLKDPGEAMFYGEPGALIEKLEILDLGSAPSVVESAKIPTTQAAGGGPPIGSQATSATDGWIDGLAEWLATPTNAGKKTLEKEGSVWRFKGPEAIGFGAKLTPPRVASNVAVRFTVKHGRADAVGIQLRIQKGPGRFYQGMLWPDGKANIKLSKDGQETYLAKGAPIPGFDPAVSHILEFRAEGEVLMIVVDGETRATAKDGTFASGGLHVTGGLIEKIEYRDLGSAPSVAESARIPTSQAGGLATSATSDGWTDGLAEWLEVPGNVKSGNLKAEAGAWRHAGSSAIALGTHLPGRSLANLAVRVTVREMMSNGVVIHLRDDAKTKRQYGVSLGKKFGITQVTLNTDGKTEQLASFKAPAGFNPEARHTLEFRAEGELLTVLVDGQQTGAIKDATLATGRMEVNPMSGLIEKIEYRDLGSAPATPAPAKPSLTWIDKLAEVRRFGTSAAGYLSDTNYEDSGTEVRWLKYSVFTVVKSAQDAAIRVTWLPATGKTYRMTLRRTEDREAIIVEASREGTLTIIRSQAGTGRDEKLKTFPFPAGTDANVPHTLEVRVIGSVLTAYVNDQFVGTVDNLPARKGDMEISTTADGVVRSVEYAALDGVNASAAESARIPNAQDGSAGPSVGSLATSTTSDGWTDGLAEWVAVPGNVAKGTLKQEGAVWRYNGPEDIGLGAKLTPPRVAANVAVRYSVRFDSKQSSINIKLRKQKAAGCFYEVTVIGSGRAGMSLTKDGQRTELVGYPSLAGFDETAAHVIEFRAEGDKLTLLMDGVERGSVNDSTYASGGLSVFGHRIEQIEYRALGSAAVAPIVATGNTQPGGGLATSATPPTPTNPKLAALLPNYTKAITAGLAAASATDKPAFEAELARLKNNIPLPDAAEDAKLPAELKRLRGILRAQLK